ncbi:MAG: hypothetical protein HONBIEJF_01102 [Fimbriimonadaceae bacterium]|nr:hypothetical protein [Fimbriimonadaceae bacterium]
MARPTIFRGAAAAHVRRKLVKPMELHTADVDRSERHASWLELFFDLIFVAAVAQLSARLTADFTGLGLAKFILLFIPVWWAWVGHTFYLSRFDNDDLGHRLLTMGQMVGVAGMAVYIPAALETAHEGFALSYALVRLLLVAEYVRAGRHIPRVLPLTRRYATCFAIALSFWIVSAWVPVPYAFALWGIGLCIDFYGPLAAGKLHSQFPPHVSHLPERFGLFTILVLGESVIATVLGVAGNVRGIAGGSAGFIALLLAFMIWWGYFDGVKAAEHRHLAPDRILSYQVWLYAHLPIAMSIVIVAISAKKIILDPMHAPELLKVGGLVGGMFVIMVLFTQLYVHSPAYSLTEQERRSTLIHYRLALLAIPIAVAAPFMPGIVSLGLISMVILAQVIYSVIRTPFDQTVSLLGDEAAG